MKITAKIFYHRENGRRNAEIKSFRNTLEAFRYAMRRATEKNANAQIKYF